MNVEEMLGVTHLTPFRQLGEGELDIHEHIDPCYETPKQALTYLSLFADELRMVSGATREHPFEAGKRVPVFNICWDGIRYSWDINTVKYVRENYLRLPDAFIRYALSEEARQHLKAHMQKRIDKMNSGEIK